MRNTFIGFFLFVAIIAILLGSCQSEEQLNYARYYVNGRNVYIQHCQNCHGAKGEGLGELIPPLTDTVFLKQNRNKLACFIKYGLSDSLVIHGRVYQEEMPAEPDMPQIEIAELVTYITNSFGNKQGLYDVKEAGKDLEKCVLVKKK